MGPSSAGLLNIFTLTAACVAIFLGLLLARKDELIFGQLWEHCPLFIEKMMVLSSHYMGIHTVINSSRIVFSYRGMKPNKDDLNYVRVEDTHLNSVFARVYRPVAVTRNAKAPAVIYIVGGGFVFASKESHNGFCYRLARTAKVVVFLVEYRRAPEHTFPAAINDCYEASIHVANNAANYSVDPSRIVLMGDGSGGNLAAAVAQEVASMKQKCVQFGFAAQVLIYPTLQFFDFSLPSFQKDAAEVSLSTESIATSWSLYLNSSTYLVELFLSGNHSRHLRQSRFQSYLRSVESDVNLPDVDTAKVPELVRKALTDPRACPLLADDLRQNPRTLIITADHDVLRDDGILYGVRLKTVGVKVTHYSYPCQHDFLFTDFDNYFAATEARQAFNDIVAFLEDVLKEETSNES